MVSFTTAINILLYSSCIGKRKLLPSVLMSSVKFIWDANSFTILIIICQIRIMLFLHQSEIHHIQETFLIWMLCSPIKYRIGWFLEFSNLLSNVENKKYITCLCCHVMSIILILTCNCDIKHSHSMCLVL